MAAPTTSRSAPGGAFLSDGYQTLVAFQADPDVSFWEKTVKPPGVDGGAPVNTTTMHNVTVRTMAPRNLITMTDMSVKVAYDPRVYEQILLLVNTLTGITVHFSDGSTLDFYGWLQKFEPSDCADGAQPEATVVITPSNMVPVTFAESTPNYKTASGTDI
jgi:hypothetical protein